MPKENKCLIVFVLDRSGSMEMVRDDTIGGFNSFIQGQKEVPGEAEVYMAQFDNRYEVVHENVQIDKVPELTGVTFKPRGTTALYDAVGKTIDEIGGILANTPEEDKPEKVMFCILTDGYENASEKYNADQVKERIHHQEQKYGWMFNFLAAGVDAWAIGGGMGIDKDLCFNVARTGNGIRSAYATASLNTTSYRTGTTSAPKWESDERRDDVKQSQP